MYSEAHTWPLLASATTCYTTGGRRLDDAVCLATESHVVSLSNLFDTPQISRQELLRQDYICVGFSTLSGWEALVLLNHPAKSTQEEELEQPEVVSRSEVVSLSVAQLVLRNNQKALSIDLDFRPLAPTLCQLNNDVVGVWLASADHNQLQLWRQQDDELVRCELDALDGVAWLVASPVMALDWMFDNESSILAVACQDGTIRLIIYEYNDERLTVLSTVDVIVDGPIVCVCLQLKEDRIHAVVGSLCGYVCELYFNKITSKLEGPFMVAAAYGEDSVLAVHALDQRVVVGTHSGRCTVYELEGGNYQRQWECKLPYSVHGVILLRDSDRFLVTTRRSLHLFKRQYDANLAKQRLANMVRSMYWCN
jgi:hypothetical protein